MSSQQEKKSESLGKTSFILLVTLLVVVFFDAPEMLHRISGMEYSSLRTALMSLATPVEHISEAIGFNIIGDALRSSFQSLSGVYPYGGFSLNTAVTDSAGISFDRDLLYFYTDSISPAVIDTSSSSDTIITTEYSEDNPVSILLAGDSMMGYGFGNSMLCILQDREEFQPERHYICSSGLARPDYFNWPTQLQVFFSEEEYDAVIFMIGTNDSQDFMVDGAYYEYGTDEWFEIYRQRTLDLLELLISDSIKVYWIGMPPMRSNRFNGRMENFNTIYSECCQTMNNESICYIPTNNILGDESGSYTAYLDVHGTTIRVRDDDGIHLSESGGDLIAELVLDKMESDFCIGSHSNLALNNWGQIFPLDI